MQAQDAVRWAEQEGYDRYLEPSIKGSTEVDGSDPAARVPGGDRGPGSGFRAGPLSSRVRFVTAVPCDRSV